MAKKELSVGELSRRSGLPVSTLHFCERMGLIASERSPADHQRAALHAQASAADAHRHLVAKRREKRGAQPLLARGCSWSWRRDLPGRCGQMKGILTGKLVPGVDIQQRLRPNKLIGRARGMLMPPRAWRMPRRRSCERLPAIASYRARPAFRRAAWWVYLR
jgi:hypothetical protein